MRALDTILNLVDARVFTQTTHFHGNPAVDREIKNCVAGADER